MSKINPKSNKNIFTNDILDFLPPNKNIKRGVKNAEKGMDPNYQETIRKRVKDQWEKNDQSDRIEGVRRGVKKLWEKEEYREKQRATRAQTGQYSDPEKTANFKSPIIGTCKKTGKELIFYGAIQLKEAGFEPGNIYSCLNGIRKSAGGYTWKRKL